MFISETELLKARLAAGKKQSDSHILRELLQEDARSEKKKRMREGERYYQGEHDILQKDFRQSPISEAGRKPGEESIKMFFNPNRSNHHCVNPFHHTLVAQKTAYLVGREPTVTVKGADGAAFERALEEMTDEAFNGMLNRWVTGAANKGVEYLHVYYDEDGAFRYCIVPAEEVLAVYDEVYQQDLREVIRYYDCLCLAGGTTAETTGSAYTNFLEAAEKEDFNVLAYEGSDLVTKKLFVNFTKRMRDEEGVKFVTVLHDFPQADHEGVISVGTAAELVFWTAGAAAGAEVNESLTNTVYDGEYAIDAKRKKSQFIKGIQEGQFLFYEEDGGLKVLRDINSFTSFETTKNSDFSSNRVVRVLDSIANDVAGIFSRYYLGKQSNNSNGRNLLKAEILAYHEELQKLEAIENFTADDITVEKGREKQDVVVYESVQPVDAMEKLYMRVEII